MDDFMNIVREIVMSQVPPHARPQPCAHRTLFTTLDHSDAICAGHDCAEQVLGEDGGFSVDFDGRGAIPSVVLTGVEGEVHITGLRAIREARKALEAAELLALRMVGQSPRTNRRYCSRSTLILTLRAVTNLAKALTSTVVFESAWNLR